MTHLHLLLHIVTLDTEALFLPWHQFIYSLLVPDGRLAIQPVHDSVLQVLIICMSFTSKVLLHLQEEVKVRWCQVRTVWGMVECVPKLNNCAACTGKRSLLSRCPTYLSNWDSSVDAAYEKSCYLTWAWHAFLLSLFGSLATRFQRISYNGISYRTWATHYLKSS